MLAAGLILKPGDSHVVAYTVDNFVELPGQGMHLGGAVGQRRIDTRIGSSAVFHDFAGFGPDFKLPRAAAGRLIRDDF